ncbi:MAG: PhoX family phosphatase, partial [Hyphomicrobiaceae bacterium]
MTTTVRRAEGKSTQQTDAQSGHEAGPAGGMISRREAMSAGLAAVISSALPCGPGRPTIARADDDPTPSFNFTELSIGSDGTHHVADGYDADVLIRWGDKVLAGAPDFDPHNQTAAAQALQFGYNNDFVGYVPLEGSSSHGLLVVNHEYTNPELMFQGVAKCDANGRTIKPEKAREQAQLSHVEIQKMAHGGTVVEVRRTAGKWEIVPNSKYARRITAETAMEFRGPAAGHKLLRTNYDPSGRAGRGMIANCSGGLTPWGTWLTGEENFHLYFHNSKPESGPVAALGAAYGIPSDIAHWSKFDDRFDVAKEPNEPNRCGWLVEIDPLDPDWTPIRRTALGRFKREGAGCIVNSDGRLAIYMGDDERFEFVYRFVSDRKVDLENRSANRHLLDGGTLYAAHFEAGGRGVWLPLVHGLGALDDETGFDDQGEVLVKTRQAAHLMGATPMDRPEDIEADPKTGKVFVMLTSNDKRKKVEVDAANPRAKNESGHIIEITPDGGDHTALTFRWEIVVLCGDPSDEKAGATFNKRTSPNGWFANPDNCVVDPMGRLWIATDGNTLETTGRADGIWALETEGKARGTGKHFFRCPVGAEMCGPAFTPDGETFFVAVQHPGELGCKEGISTFDASVTNWPETDGKGPPRPAVIAI